MNETYKKALLAVLSIAIVFLGIFFVIRPANEDTKKIKKETTDLTTYLNDLKSKEVNRDQYIADTAANYEMFDEKLAEFPSNLDQEYQIEFIQGVRKNPDINYDVQVLDMAQPMTFYALGTGSSDASTDTTTADTSSEDGAVATDGADDQYICYTSTMALEYEGDYKGVKAFVDYVSSYAYRMTIDGVSVSESRERPGVFEGEMTVNVYCIAGKGREENAEINLNEIQTGVDNLFTSGSSNAAVSKYASDNGEAIKADYDLYLAVNPAGSDASAKVVGLKSGGTNVTSNKTESEQVTVSVSKDGDKYVVEYAIGNNKQRQEFDPGEDLTMLIQSSDLKDEAADQNKVVLSLENSTDKTLYVKVADDASANRIKIANRAGSISVYK
ncbi:MAG: hypothetical protein PUA92_08010 [Clostridium sp.]|nr:hypothetical protein [Clostridium sp.]